MLIDASKWRLHLSGSNNYPHDSVLNCECVLSSSIPGMYDCVVHGVCDSNIFPSTHDQIENTLSSVREMIYLRDIIQVIRKSVRI